MHNDIMKLFHNNNIRISGRVQKENRELKQKNGGVGGDRAANNATHVEPSRAASDEFVFVFVKWVINVIEVSLSSSFITLT